MASSEQIKSFVNELESFTEKKKPSFELGKNESLLSKYTSAATADSFAPDYLHKSAQNSDKTDPPLNLQSGDETFKKKKLLGAQAASKNRSVDIDISNRGYITEDGVVKSYTDAGGGAVFRTKKDENGDFRESKVDLKSFKERSDKRGFKNKTTQFVDVGERIVEAVKAEDNETAASNVDDKAILATVIVHEKYKEDQRRLSDIYSVKKEEVQKAQRIIFGQAAARQEMTDVGENGIFSTSNAAFTDKGENFSNKYLTAFRDKDANLFSENYNMVVSDYLDSSVKAETIAAVVRQKKEQKLKQTDTVTDVSENEQSIFDKKNELSVVKSDTRISSVDMEIDNEEQFAVSTVGAYDNKIKKSVDSYFSNESGTVSRDSVESNVSDSQSWSRESLELKKSEAKAAKDAKKKAVKKAAAIAAVSNMLRMKKEMQNDVGNMNPTGNLIRDGSSGMLRATTDAIKNAVLNKIRGLLVKVVSAMMAGLLHILTLMLPLITVVVIVIAIMTSFLSVFTDSSNIPDGDGYLYSSLTETDIDEIIQSLYQEFPGVMNPDRENLMRYALSRVGCAYDQAYHWSLTADIFDCSSLAYRAYREVGIDISNGGVYSAAEICRNAVDSGYIGYGDLQPGDLIFYGGRNNGRFQGVYHVAIYVGDGKMVEARGSSWGVVYCDVRTANVVGYSRYI